MGREGEKGKFIFKVLVLKVTSIIFVYIVLERYSYMNLFVCGKLVFG